MCSVVKSRLAVLMCTFLNLCSTSIKILLKKKNAIARLVVNIRLHIYCNSNYSMTLGVGLLVKLPEKNTGHPVNFEFQVNNK